MFENFPLTQDVDIMRQTKQNHLAIDTGSFNSVYKYLSYTVPCLRCYAKN